MADYRHKIKGLLEAYDLGILEYTDDQSHGYANQNFKVRSNRGNYFIRFCQQQSVENVEQEILLMSVLRENKFKTAYPISRKDGSFISLIDSIPVLVYEFLDGRLPSLNHETVSEIAGAVGHLSTLSYPPGLNKKNAISIDDSIELIGLDVFRDFRFKDVTDSFERHIKELEPAIRIKLPEGIVHGDVFPDNTLYSDNRLIGLIDFEEFAIDSLMFDVGMTINGFCFNETEMNANLIGTFLNHYNKFRILSIPEANLLTDYMAWGAVGMTSWHLHQLLYKNNPRQLDRVRTLLKRAGIILERRGEIENITKTISEK